MSLPQSSSSCVFVCAGILHIPGIRCSLFQELKCDSLLPHEDSRNHFSCFSTVKCQKFAAKIRHRILYNVSSNLIYFILCVCLCSPSFFSPVLLMSTVYSTQLCSLVWCAFLPSSFRLLPVLSECPTLVFCTECSVVVFLMCWVLSLTLSFVLHVFFVLCYERRSPIFLPKSYSVFKTPESWPRDFCVSFETRNS